MKHLEAVTVCVNYGDILRITMPYNKPLFDKWTIVTSPEDRETMDVCRYYRIPYVVTDKMYDDCDKFNKGKAINEGLKKLKKNDWILHIDADIMLPANFRQICKEDQLQKDAIYGIDRTNVIGDRNLFKLLISKRSQIRYWTYLDLSLMCRYNPTFRLHNLNAGFNVIGFFQLFHSSHLKEKHKRGQPWYPQEHHNAARTDVQFQQQWDLDKRLFYPGIIGYHIMTQNLGKGIDWEGRVTCRVGQGKNKNWCYVPEYPDDVYDYKAYE